MSLLNGLLRGADDSPWTAHEVIYGEYQYGGRHFERRKLYLDRYEGASTVQYMLFSPDNWLLADLTVGAVEKKRGEWVTYRYKRNGIYRVVKVDRQVLLGALKRIQLPPDYWDKKYPPRS